MGEQGPPPSDPLDYDPASKETVVGLARAMARGFRAIRQDHSNIHRELQDIQRSSASNHDHLERLSRTIVGDGDVEESLVFRISQIERDVRACLQDRRWSRGAATKIWLALIAAFGGLAAQLVTGLLGR